MVKAAGYAAETHFATTDDGYILALHRIPKGRDENGGGSLHGAVCYLQHGLMCSSADWVIPAPEKGLGKAIFLG
jgi:lysosomal acid lipase/cholesteryl ester hydrolase